jgi:peptide/nickel transport system permease protein
MPLAVFQSKSWKRLQRNWSAMAGLMVIMLAVPGAIFAYLIAPDNSPDGNEQILQLETHPPGYQAQLLMLPADRQQSSFAEGILNGFRKEYLPVPVLKAGIRNDSVWYTEYRGTSFPPLERVISAQAAGLRTIDDKGLNERICKRTYWLGTDKFGRDILSRLIIGVRVSLSVGFLSVGISLLIGIVLGALSGYFGGKIDELIMWLINVFWSVPTLLLAMGLYIGAGSWFDSKLVLIFLAVGLTMWVEVARIVRGQIMVLREMEFVTAARSLGFSHARTIFVHILPNLWGPVIVVACANFANAILVESGLSYIGLGVMPPAPSWGSMLNEYKDYIDTNKAYLAIFPGGAIMLLVLAFNLLGNGLRDALDVKGKTE